MTATDVKPSRLDAARAAGDAFLAKVPSTYNIALVAFASRAFLAVPPTTDHDLVRKGLTELNAGEGTALGDAILLAARVGQRQRGTEGVVPPTSVLLISDGARQGGRTPPLVAARRARAAHVTVSTVLVGTPNGIVTDDGNTVELGDGMPHFGNKVPAGYVFVDGLSVGDVGSVVLRDRRVLSTDGIFIVIVTVDKDTGQVVSGPDLISRGFVHQQTSDALLESARQQVLSTINKPGRGTPEWQVIKNSIRDSLSKYLYDQMRRRPMIIPIVVEV